MAFLKTCGRRYPILLLGMMLSSQALCGANVQSSHSFQSYFANTRHCLNVKDFSNCLKLLIAEEIHQPADNLSQGAFVELIMNDEGMRNHLKSCFSIDAKIILSTVNYKLFRSSDFACGVTKTEDGWQLEQFYNFFSQE